MFFFDGRHDLSCSKLLNKAGETSLAQSHLPPSSQLWVSQIRPHSFLSLDISKLCTSGAQRFGSVSTGPICLFHLRKGEDHSCCCFFPSPLRFNTLVWRMYLFFSPSPTPFFPPFMHQTGPRVRGLRCLETSPSLRRIGAWRSETCRTEPLPRPRLSSVPVSSRFFFGGKARPIRSVPFLTVSFLGEGKPLK